MRLVTIKKGENMKSNVNYELLNECSNELKKVANNMLDRTDQITEIIKGIEKNNFWSGSGADYFQQQYRMLIPFFNEGYDQVVNYALTLENVISGYKFLDETVSKIIE